MMNIKFLILLMTPLICSYFFMDHRKKGELFIMPLLGITEKFMMFTFQSYSHTFFVLLMYTYLSCLVYVYIKTENIWILYV